jgi:hypothetical protein
MVDNTMKLPYICLARKTYTYELATTLTRTHAVSSFEQRKTSFVAGSLSVVEDNISKPFSFFIFKIVYNFILLSTCNIITVG